MKLGGSSGGAAAGKPSPVIMIALIVLILGAGFFLYRTMTGGGEEQAPTTDVASGPPTAAPPGAPAGAPPGAQTPPTGGPGGPPPSAGAPPRPMAGPGPSAGVPGPKPGPRPAPAAPPAKPAPEVKMSQIKVFNTVGVSFPSTWKIKAGAGNASAIFTNGSAFFEVHAPDLKAQNAKAIAESGVKQLAPGARIMAQGAEKVANQDAYHIVVSYGGGSARIVGVDAPTRVVLFEHVSGSQFAAYKDTFSKMESGMSFGR